MIFLKKCYLNTTEKVDVLSLLHDIRYAIRDARIDDGLITLLLPKAGAGFVVSASDAQSSLHKRREETLPRTMTLPFATKDLLLAPKEEVFCIDFESKMGRREMIFQVMGEAKPEKTEAPKTGGRR